MRTTLIGHTRSKPCPDCGVPCDSRAARCRDCFMGTGNTTKRCARCGETKPRDDFYRRPDRPAEGHQGRLAWCKPCTLDWHRWHRLLKKYGVTETEYRERLTMQGGVCAICRGEPTRNGVLHVDHDHATGEVRGLLCHGCNQGLGHFRDDAVLLAAALAYLR